MEYYEITYHVRYHMTGKKYISTELGRTDAINKTHLRYDRILSVRKIIKEDFLAEKKKNKCKEIER